MANNRIFYATQAVMLTPLLQSGDTWTAAAAALCPRGLQSVGITTNFTLEQVYQLGQLELYDNIEDVPEVQVTMNKVIDGTMPLYLMCMGGGLQGSGKALAEIVNNRVNFRLQIYNDNNSASTGTPAQFVNATGMYLSSVSYTFPVDGNATEDVTLVGNNKFWNNASNGGDGTNISNGAIFGTGTAPSTARRYKLIPGNCTLPTGVGGIPNGSHFQSISVSTDLGREAIQELGSMAPYFRFVTFPLEVTSEFEIIAISGDQMDANDFTAAASCTGTYKNLTDKTIKVKVCGTGATDYLELDLGAKNKLTSVNYTGGDAGGGNATITYSFQTFNKLVVNVTGSFTSAAIS